MLASLPLFRTCEQLHSMYSTGCGVTILACVLAGEIPGLSFPRRREAEAAGQSHDGQELVQTTTQFRPVSTCELDMEQRISVL